MKIVGLDLSLTSTGIAYQDDDEVHTHAIKSKLHDTPRLIEIREQILAVVLFPFVADLVVIEGYSYGSPAGATRAHAIGELGGVIKLALHEHGIPCALIPPKLLKKYATDRGNASKVEMLTAAVKRSGIEFRTDDEADAWWLREMGCARFGEPHVQMPAASAAAVATVEWPDIEEHVHA